MISKLTKELKESGKMYYYYDDQKKIPGRFVHFKHEKHEITNDVFSTSNALVDPQHINLKLISSINSIII